MLNALIVNMFYERQYNHFNPDSDNDDIKLLANLLKTRYKTILFLS